MWAVGIIWAVFAPLLLAPVVALLAWLLSKARIRLAVPLAVLAVVLPVSIFWFIDWSEFDKICKTEGAPVVYRRSLAEGIFLNSGTSNSFGMRYLQEEGFSWVEARSVTEPGAWVRYERSANGTISTTRISALTARYEVREDFIKPDRHTGLSRTQVIDRVTGELVAKAASANFDGGRMNAVLGVWGSRSCPSAMSSPEGFDGYYHLASHALR
ncbi:MAG TPA: hypothetical protein VI319_13780 [Burkholderiales bacterium]